MVEAVIFDLDGVLVTTDEFHYLAWKHLAEELGIHNFTKEDNVRQRGVSRMASLEVVLEKGDKIYTEEEKLELADKKNNIYVASLKDLSPEDILPGVTRFLAFLKEKGIKTAIGSASKNTPLILEKTGLASSFDAISCGLDTTKSKPDPEVFLIAASKLGVAPENCVVVEDSDAGIQAAKSGGMYALAVGAAKENPLADCAAESLDVFSFEKNGWFCE
ncbi:MAG: beta-phosphoglucomutase [Clostridia bacterium]|nr:beta-phosphoglucomutase [Clostridia bacterium]